MLAALLTNLQTYGGGYPTPFIYERPTLPKKNLDKQIKNWVDDIVLSGEQTPLTAEVKKLIEPYRETVDFSIDWAKLKKDLLALEQLLFLYQERDNYRAQLLREDEEFMVILYASIL